MALSLFLVNPNYKQIKQAPMCSHGYFYRGNEGESEGLRLGLGLGFG